MKHYSVVCAVVVNNGEVLCMQRPESKYSYISNHWEFPGGKIEEGETPEQAVHRELLEEMDYDVRVGEYLCTVNHEYQDFTINMQAFLCTANTRAFNMKEHLASRWMKPENFGELDFCPADQPILGRILQVLKK